MDVRHISWGEALAAGAIFTLIAAIFIGFLVAVTIASHGWALLAIIPFTVMTLLFKYTSLSDKML